MTQTEMLTIFSLLHANASIRAKVQMERKMWKERKYLISVAVITHPWNDDGGHFSPMKKEKNMYLNMIEGKEWHKEFWHSYPFIFETRKALFWRKKSWNFKIIFVVIYPYFSLSFMGCTILFFLFLWGGHIFCLETKINISLKFKPWITWFAYQPKDFCYCMFLYFWQLIISTLAIHTC